MRIGSLFSGIGGLELGLERAIPGAHTVFQDEANPYARQVLAKHWPTTPRIHDVKEANASNLPPCDILAGGFPCQDISNAGKQVGIEGKRSGLWSEFARIIQLVRPRYVVVENVAALRIRGLGQVLGDLATSGYDAVWDCVPAAAIGAPHRRDRLFVIGIANPNRDVANPNGPRLQGRFSESLQECTGQWLAGQGGTRPSGVQDHWFIEPHVGRVATGVPRRVDRLKCLGNAVVPQVGQVVGRTLYRIIEDQP